MASVTKHKQEVALQGSLFGLLIVLQGTEQRGRECYPDSLFWLASRSVYDFISKVILLFKNPLKLQEKFALGNSILIR